MARVAGDFNPPIKYEGCKDMRSIYEVRKISFLCMLFGEQHHRLWLELVLCR